MSGTVNISRSIWADAAFKDQPFTEREAFIWMVMEASYKPREKRIGSIVVNLERGQLASSVRFMSEAWNWTKSTVDRFLKRLEKRDMIGTDSGTGISVITIRKYDEYQNAPGYSGTPENKKRDSSGTAAGQQRDKPNKGLIPDAIQKKEDTNVSLIDVRKQRDEWFNEFWSRYPRKIAKPNARKAYDKALKEHRHDDIMFGLSKHLPSLQAKETQFIPHAATWLNGERFNDEPEQSDRMGGPRDTRAHATTDAITFAGTARRTPSKDCF